MSREMAGAGEGDGDSEYCAAVPVSQFVPILVSSFQSIRGRENCWDSISSPWEVEGEVCRGGPCKPPSLEDDRLRGPTELDDPEDVEKVPTLMSCETGFAEPETLGVAVRTRCCRPFGYG